MKKRKERIVKAWTLVAPDSFWPKDENITTKFIYKFEKEATQTARKCGLNVAELSITIQN